jgi:hypothetical protein
MRGVWAAETHTPTNQRTCFELRPNGSRALGRAAEHAAAEAKGAVVGERHSLRVSVKLKHAHHLCDGV